MKSRTPQCSGFYEKLNALRAEVFSVEEPRLFFPLTDILLFLWSWEQCSVLLPAHSCLLKTSKAAIAAPPPAPAPQLRRWSKLHLEGNWGAVASPQLSAGCRTSPKDTKTCAWGLWDWKCCCGVETSPHSTMVQHHLVQGNEKYSRNYSKLQWQLLGKLLLVKDN